MNEVRSTHSARFWEHPVVVAIPLFLAFYGASALVQAMKATQQRGIPFDYWSLVGPSVTTAVVSYLRWRGASATSRLAPPAS